MADPYEQEFNSAFPNGVAGASSAASGDPYEQEFNNAFPKGVHNSDQTPSAPPTTFQPMGNPNVTPTSTVAPDNTGSWSSMFPKGENPFKPLTIDTSGNSKAVADIDTQTIANLNKQGLSNQTSLATEGIGSPTNKINDLTRMDLGLSTNDNVWQETFKQYFPTGSAIRNPADNSILFKTDATSPFIRFSPNTQQKALAFKDAFNSDDMSIKFNTITNLIAGMIEDNPGDTTKTVILNLVTPGIGFGKLLIALPATQAAVGAVSNAYEGSRGRSTQFIEDAKNDALVGLAAWMTMGVLAKSGPAIYNTLTGKPLLNLDEYQVGLRESYERLKNLSVQLGTLTQKDADGMPILLHQMSSNKLIQSVSKQIGNVSETIANAVKRQSDMVVNTIDARVNPQAIADAPKIGQDLEQSGKIQGQIAAQVGYPNTSAKTAGDALAGDLGSYARRSQSKLNDLYKARDSLEEPIYGTPTPALKAADEVEKGIKQLYVSEPSTEISPITGPSGEQISKTVPGKLEGKQLQTVPPELNQAIADIRNWKNSPIIGVPGNTATDQIQAIQRNIFPFTQAENTGANQNTTRLATKLYKGLQDVLDNPINPSPAFQAANQATKTAAAQRFDNLQDPLVSKAYRLENDELLSSPEAMVSSITNGKSISQLDRIKNLVSPDTYETVLNHVRTNLLDNPGQLSSVMGKLDNTANGREFASRIFPDQATKDSFKEWGKTADSLNALGLTSKAANISSAPDQGIQAGTKYLNDILQGNPSTIQARMDTLSNLIQNNPNSEMNKSIQSGLLRYLLDNSTHLERGHSIIKPAPFEKILQMYGDNTQMRFLSPQYQQMLKDAQEVAAAIGKGGTDMGTSMQQGELGAEVLRAPGDLIKHGKIPTEILSFITEHIGLGKLLASKTVSKILYGSPLTRPGETMPNAIVSRAITSAKGLDPNSPSSTAKALTRFFTITNPAIRATNGGTTTYHKTNEQTDRALGGR